MTLSILDPPPEAIQGPFSESLLYRTQRAEVAALLSIHLSTSLLVMV